MPGWVVTLISVAASAVVSGIVGFFIKRTLDRYFAKKDQEQREKEEKLEKAEALLEEKKQKTLEETMNRVVEAHTAPINEKLEKLDDKVSKIENGTLDTLRDRILSTYYKCLEKGYRTQYDFENVHHMYKDYLNLEGNSFVADCVSKFDLIISEEEYRIQQKKRSTSKNTPKKKILTEVKK